MSDTTETVAAPPPPEPAPSALRRLYNGGASVVNWLVNLFEPARKLIINAGIIAGIVIGGPAVYKLATKPNFVIKDIQVPSDLSDRGFTGDVIAQQILDHIAEIDRIGGSKKEKAAISGFDLESSMPSIQLPVGGFNLNAVVAEVRQLLGVTETKVTGEIYTAVAADDDKKIPAEYGVRLRLAGKGPILKGTPPDAHIDNLVEEAAERIMHQFDPINLGYYFYRLKRYDKAYETTVAALADPCACAGVAAQSDGEGTGQGGVGAPFMSKVDGVSGQERVEGTQSTSPGNRHPCSALRKSSSPRSLRLCLSPASWSGPSCRLTRRVTSLLPGRCTIRATIWYRI